MRVSVIGTGYVGLVLGACMADFGNDVVCMDKDKDKIAALKKGRLPIYEPGLSDVFDRSVSSGRLVFTNDIKKAVTHGKVVFLALPTPTGEFYEADLTAVIAVAKEIGRHMNEPKVIVNKSTVPVGTAHQVRRIIKEHQKKRVRFDVVSNPEFLREGAAVRDFQMPDRVVIGVDNGWAKEMMLNLYKPFARVSRPIMVTDVLSSEIIKYASNAMLATRISFMNQLSRLCDSVGADVKEVAKGMGMDSRIGWRFLQAGVGYGGSCFPKDVKALIHTLKENSCSASLFEAVDNINEEQKRWAAQSIEALSKGITGKRFGIWGLSFKPRTDDIREAPSIVLMEGLLAKGAGAVRVFDPVSVDSFRKQHPELCSKVHLSKDPYDAAEGADCLVLVTEWDLFRSIDMARVKGLMKTPLIFDGRNMYEKEELRSLGFTYKGVGR